MSDMTDMTEITDPTAPTDTAILPVVFQQPGHPPATMTEHKGVRYLHLGTTWVQGAMHLQKPDAIELDYVQMMMIWTLFLRQPDHIVQLGLGSAALTKFCYHRFPAAQVTAVELNPNVIAMCSAWFGLPPNDARLHVLEMDALDFVTDPANRDSADILQVDLYDEEARGPVLDSPAFYQACHDCLRPGGIMTTNIFGELSGYDKNLAAMADVFDAVVWLPEVHDANIIVIAFKDAPQIDFKILRARAAAIKADLDLRAKPWVTGLQAWMAEQ
jgi:spermidine synthase